MSRLARKQLDKRFREMHSIADFPRPPRGWIRAIREALEMTAAQLGERLKVSQPRITALEKSEMEDSITLETLRRAAEALDCRLVYAFVPRESLDEMVMARARAVADKKLSRVDHTMRLENQSIDSQELSNAREELARTLAEKPRRLWDNP